MRSTTFETGLRELHNKDGGNQLKTSSGCKEQYNSFAVAEKTSKALK